MDTEHFNSSDYTYDNHFDIIAEIKPHTTGIVVNSVLLCVPVCANIWMIRSLYKSWETGSRMHFYLLAICIADVLGVCVRSGVNIGIFATGVWKGGYYGCKIFSGVQMYGTTMSHLILAGFNIDNLFTISRGRSTKALRIAFLLLSFVTTSIITGLKRLVPLGYSNEAFACIVDAFLPFLDIAVYFLLPFLMMLLFGLPSLFVWCCRKGTLSFEKTTGNDDSSRDLQYIGRDIGIVFAYDVVFFLCCGPIIVFFIFGWHSLVAFTVLTFLEAANACLKPFLYAIFNCIRRRRDRTSPGV